MNPRRVWAYFKVFGRLYLRRRVGLFFSLVFPIILILLFGAIFSSSGTTSVSVYVQDLDHHSQASQLFLSYLNATGVLSVTLVSPGVGNLSSWLYAQGETAGIVVPQGFGADFSNHTPVRVVVYTDPAQAAEAGIVQGAVGDVVGEMNYQASGAHPFIGESTLNVGTTTYAYIDYLVPGLISFSVLVSPMFAMTNVASQMKRDKLFRQLSLTPLTRGEWLMGSILWFLVLVALSTVLMLGIGRAVFGADVSLTPLSLPFLVAGPVVFVSLGLLTGTISKGPESASVVGNLITFPMMFLSGTFFPVDLFPSYLQTFARVLPLYYVVDGLDNTMVLGDTSAALLDLGVVIGLAVVFFVLAILAFQWREE